MTKALFIGRFQPFHVAHLKDIKDILKEHDEVLIGIGSSQYFDKFDNPFSYEERVKMIKKIMKSERIDNFSIYPIEDIGDDKKWIDQILDNFPKFDAVYSGNDWTLNCFKNYNHLDYELHKINLIPGISSTIIREKILNGEEWKSLVPEVVVKFLEKIDGVERIKRINSKV